MQRKTLIENGFYFASGKTVNSEYSMKAFLRLFGVTFGQKLVQTVHNQATRAIVSILCSSWLKGQSLLRIKK